MSITTPSSVCRRVVPLATLLLAAACAADEPEPAPPDAAPGAPPPAAERPPPDDERPPFFSPGGGPPGTEVSVRMSDLGAHANVSLGFGTVEAHEILRYSESDEHGNFEIIVDVPATAEPHRSHYFFVADESGRPIGVSNAFLVTAEDGSVRVRGEVTDEGATCTAMRGYEDELYTLVGDVGTPAPGTRLLVEGTIAESSVCQQGLTLEVSSARVEG